jgi:AcrR family transcriptional regulator
MQKSRRAPKTDEMATLRGRGRPRAFDREAALAQATRLFWLKGYEATSIADLTEAMGIGSPSLYAAFSSKEALYAEALRYYRENYETLFWGNFNAADTAREAMRSLLLDSAAALTGCVADVPNGCMVALSSVGNEGHEQLGELVRTARAVGLERLEARLRKAVTEGEIPASTNVQALARFVQTVQAGMSILARDGASRAELVAVAEVAMAGWDAGAAG